MLHVSSRSRSTSSVLEARNSLGAASGCGGTSSRSSNALATESTKSTGIFEVRSSTAWQSFQNKVGERCICVVLVRRAGPRSRCASELSTLLVQACMQPMLQSGFLFAELIVGAGGCPLSLLANSGLFCSAELATATGSCKIQLLAHGQVVPAGVASTASTAQVLFSNLCNYAENCIECTARTQLQLAKLGTELVEAFQTGTYPEPAALNVSSLGNGLWHEVPRTGRLTSLSEATSSLTRLADQVAVPPASVRNFVEERLRALETVRAVVPSFETELALFLKEVADEGLALSDIWHIASDWAQVHAQSTQSLVSAALVRRAQNVEVWLLRNLASTPKLDGSSSRYFEVVRAPLTAQLHALAAAEVPGLAGSGCLPRNTYSANMPLRPRSRGSMRPKSSSLLSGSPVVGEIDAWVDRVRRTGAVAAGSDDAAWRKQLGLLKAGLAGTIACLSLGSEDESKSAQQEHQTTSCNDADDECPVCLEPLVSKSRQITQLQCGHNLHAACAAQWLQRRPRCPVCRQSPFMPAGCSRPSTPCEWR